MKNREFLLKRIWAEHDDQRALMPLYASQELIDKRLGAILCPGPFYYYIFNHANHKFDYFSQGLEKIMGLKLEDTSLATFLERVHPNDLEFMRKCEKLAGNFMFETIHKNQIPDYKVCYSYLMKDKESNYRLIYQQTIVVSMDIEGRISKVLGVHTDISHLVEKNNYKISFIGLNGQPTYLAQDVLNNGHPQKLSNNPLSKREIEIVRLLADGNDTKAIADQLKIAPGTVNVHRRNALKKTNCKNVAHLVAKCIRSGWV